MQSLIANDYDRMIIQCGYGAASKYIHIRNPGGLRTPVLTCDSSTGFNVEVMTTTGIVSRDDHPLDIARQHEAFKLILEHGCPVDTADTRFLHDCRYVVVNTYRHLITRLYDHKKAQK
jgi:hypothetical protein